MVAQQEKFEGQDKGDLVSFLYSTGRFTLEEWLSFLNGKAQELKTET